MRRTLACLTRALVLAAAVVPTAAGCDAYPPITVPSGGQVVHAVVTDGTLSLLPTAADAGDVYLLIDTPGTEILFIQGMAEPGEGPGPLADQQIEALRSSGSTFHTAITCCYARDPRGGAAARLSLTPGKYVLLVQEVTTSLGPDGAPVRPGAMAVLEVGD